jgi:hypothetical protein
VTVPLTVSQQTVSQRGQSEVVRSLLQSESWVIVSAVPDLTREEFFPVLIRVVREHFTYFLSLPREHRASTKHLQRILFWAKAPISFQVFVTFPISSRSTVLLLVLLSLPLLRRHWGGGGIPIFNLFIICESFLKVCLIHSHFISLIFSFSSILRFFDANIENVLLQHLQLTRKLR